MRWTQRQQLRRRCNQALEHIVVPAPWDLQDFLGALSAHRGRPILLSEAPELDNQAVSAQWWKESQADVILYAPTQSVFYLELNVFHEVGHMLCGHDTSPHGGPFAAGDMEVLANAPGAAATIFSRSSRFDSAEEQEAEFIAYRLKLMIEREGHVIGVEDDPDTAHMRSTMRRTLGSSGE